MTRSDRTATAALTTLILLQATMLAALYAQISPHPPAATPLFGIAPFIGASVSLAVSAVILGPSNDTAGRTLSVLAALTALVSFGPHKFLDAQIGLIWPAVILGHAAALVVVAQALRVFGRRDGSAAGRPHGEQA